MASLTKGNVQGIPDFPKDIPGLILPQTELSPLHPKPVPQCQVPSSQYMAPDRCSCLARHLGLTFDNCPHIQSITSATDSNSKICSIQQPHLPIATAIILAHATNVTPDFPTASSSVSRPQALTHFNSFYTQGPF